MRSLSLLLGLAASSLALTSGTAFAADMDAIPEQSIEWGDSDSHFRVMIGAAYLDTPGVSLGRVVTPDGSRQFTSDGNGWGPSFEALLGGEVGTIGGVAVLFEARGFLMGADSDSRQRIDTSRGIFAFEGLTTGGLQADIISDAFTTLPVEAEATTLLQAIDSTGDPGTINQNSLTVIAGGEADAGAETLINQGVLSSFVASETIGAPSATSLGFIATDRGFLAVGAGDLSNVSISTETSVETIYGGIGLRLGVPSTVVGNIEILPFAELGYRTYRQDVDTALRFAVAPFPLSGNEVPGAQLNLDEEIGTDYLGGALGARASMPITETIDLDFESVFGLYYADTDYRGRQTATIQTPLLNAGGFTGSSVTFAGPNVNESDKTAAGSIDLSLGLSAHVSPRSTISLSGSLQHLTKVPKILRRDPIVAGNVDEIGGDTFDDVAAGNLNDPTRSTVKIGYDDATFYGLRVGYKLTF